MEWVGVVVGWCVDVVCHAQIAWTFCVQTTHMNLSPITHSPLASHTTHLLNISLVQRCGIPNPHFLHLPLFHTQAVERHGYKKPSPIQMAAIPLGLQQRDVIGIAETGSGKTAAFVLPMLCYIMKQPVMKGEKDEWVWGMSG